MRLRDFAAAAAALCLACASAEARPLRGSAPVEVLLCRTVDSGPPPLAPDAYRARIFIAGTSGASDWWRAISYGSLDLAGSRVHGWFVMPQTTAAYAALSRWDKVTACQDAARTAPAGAVTLAAGVTRYVVTFPSADLFGWTGGAFLPWNFTVGDVVHEGGHGIGLDHTFSNDPNYRNADWARIGEYDDPWDAMSWANSYRSPTPFGDAPTGLVTPHLDRMGWLPRGRVVTHGADGALERTYRVAAVERPGAPGALMLRVPYDPADPFRYYSVEFRAAVGFSAGIPGDTLLIHDVTRDRDAAGAPVGPQLAWLQRDLAAAGRPPARRLVANGVEIELLSTGPARDHAMVRVRSQIAERCLVGFVWREATPTDKTCVTPQTRAATRAENAAAARNRQPGGGAFGPNTCRQGFVWREAVPGDQVCVTGDRRAAARADNAAAPARTNPARAVFGPNTCKPGFVWREGDERDWVCVTGRTRDLTRQENAAAARNRQPGGGAFGPNTCRQGYVWRDAFPGDQTCVTGDRRQAARDDNAQAAARLMIP